MLLLTEQALGGRIVSAAATTDGQRLLVATDAGLGCYELQAAGGDPACAVHRLWQQPVSGGRVEYAAPLTHAADYYLLLTSHAGGRTAQAAVVRVLPAGGGLVRSAGGRHHVVASLQLDGRCELHEEPPARPAFSALAPCAGSNGGGALVLAAALWQATVHVLRAERSGSGGQWSLSAGKTSLYNHLTSGPGAVIAVESIALGPPSACPGGGSGSMHATLLYSAHQMGSAGAAAADTKHVACLELRASDATLHRCCWFVRGVDHATGVVAALPGAGTLVASASTALLVPTDAPHDKRQVALRLGGRPTCATPLPGGSKVVLGDASGQLHLLDTERLQAAPVAGGLLAAAPSCLAFLAAPAQAAATPAAPAGALFVGSAGGSSALLEVPASPVAGSMQWQAMCGGGAGGLPSSLAPVTSCRLIPDPSGCGDARLLMCCGQAPFARLALARLAAALVPLAVGGGDLPGLMRLLPLKASPAAARHRYLLLSSDEGGGRTAALETSGEGLQSAALPGLQLDAPTLHAGPLAGGAMVQVVPSGVRVFKPGSGAALAWWQPAGGAPITLAAQQGQHVAVACGATVQVLHCSPASGRLAEERQLSLPQQASALALFQLGDGSRGELGVAVGLWVCNEVLLQPLGAEAPACRLDLGARQPRSLLICPLGGAPRGGIPSPASAGIIATADSGYSVGGSPESSYGDLPGTFQPHTYLLVGTSSGEVLWWRLAAQHDAYGAPAGLQLAEPRGWARAGLAPVSLHLLPPDPAAALSAAAYSSGGGGGGSSAAESCVLAVSDQALLVGPDPVHPGRLAPLRLHGAQALSAACPLLAGELAGARLAYIHAGQLAIGGIEAEPRIRWDELALGGGAAPSTAAYHASSGCAAVACSEADGTAALRLVDLAAMREVGRVPMQPGQAITAVALLPLSCSSAAAAGSAAAPASSAAAQGLPPQLELPDCKQFLLVAVAEGASDAQPPMLPAEQVPPAASGADATQPWWRQQQQAQQQAQQQEEGEQDSPVPVRGQLLVYEWRQAQQQAGGSSSPAHELVLQGACPLPAAVFSLAVVPQPDPPFHPGSTSDPAAGSSAAAADAPHPLLAAGCDDGTVRLLRLYIDDAALEQGAAAGAATLAPLRLADSSCSLAMSIDSPTPAASSAGQAPPTAAGGAGQLWHQRVAAQLVAKAATCCEGVVAGLEAAGGALFARDLLASLTAFRVAPLAPGQPPALLPLAADLSGRHLTAALALSPTAVLAGAAPSGLLLVQRDPAAERDRHAAAARRWEEARELGGGGGGGAAPAQQAGQRRRYAPTLSDAVQLDAVAGHDLAGSVVAVAPGLLGVPARRLEELELDGGGLPGTPRSRHSSSASSRPPAPQPAATVVCSNGSVVAARLLTPQQHSLLSQLQRAADATSYADGDGIGPAAKLQVAGPGAAAPGGCIDSSLLAAAFMQPSWHRRLLKAAPANTVHQAAAFLEAAGLL